MATQTEAQPRTVEPEVQSSSRGIWIFCVAIVLLALIGALLLIHRKHEAVAHESETLQKAHGAGPMVKVVPVQTTPVERKVTFTGDVRAFLETTLYARVPGYVKSITVDKGDVVKEGQLLGTLESPETDQQIAAARAELSLREQLAKRASELSSKGVMSQQEREQAESALTQAQAGLQRVGATKDYAALRAPFAGRITARYVDPGALMQAQQPFVKLSDPARLKVTINVGQDVAPFIRVGDPVEVWQAEQPGSRVTAVVSRVSGELDPRTRTEAADIYLDPKTATFVPGTSVSVQLTLKTAPLPVIPGEALFVREGKAQVAVLTDGQHVHFVPIRPGLNNGKQMQVESGLSGGEKVVANVPADLDEGAVVQVFKDEPQKPAQPQLTK